MITVGNLETKVFGRVEGGDPELEKDGQLLVAHGVRLANGASLRAVAVPRPLGDARAAGDVVLSDRVGVMPVDLRIVRVGHDEIEGGILTTQLAGVHVVCSGPNALHAQVRQVEWGEVELAGFNQSGALLQMGTDFLSLMMRGCRHGGG